MSSLSRTFGALRRLFSRDARRHSRAWVEPFNDVTRAVLYGEQLPGSVVLGAPQPPSESLPAPELTAAFELALPDAREPSLQPAYEPPPGEARAPASADKATAA